MSPETTFRKQASAYVHAAGGVVATESGIVDADEFEAAPMGVDAEAAPLRALVAKAAPSVSRMASRFGQLAVLGAADCLRRLRGNVDPATRIYLATGLGDVAHTDALYFGVMPPRSEMPPPARFATSGNNMAAFFVAQHAGITARNLTVSQDELSLECALGFALSDLASGAADAAFVGGVDESTRPRDFYTRRFPVRSDQAIGEGSAWLVLDAEAERGGVRALGAIHAAYVISGPAEPDPPSLIEQVTPALMSFGSSATRPARLVVLAGSGIAESQLTALRGALDACWAAAEYCDYLAWSGRFPTAAAAGIAAMFGPVAGRRNEPLACLHVNRDRGLRTGVIALEVYRSSNKWS